MIGHQQRLGQAAAFVELDVDHLETAALGVDLGQVLDALVGGDRDAHVADAAPQLRELVDARARLLDVLQVELGERMHGVLGLVDVPAGVRVHADPALRSDGFADGPHPRDVVAQALTGFGDLDLGGAASVEAGEDLGDPLSGDGGDRGVHGDVGAEGTGRRHPPEIDRAGEPVRRLGVVVLDERGELRPALGAFEEHRLAHLDAAEARRERQRHDVGGGEEVGKDIHGPSTVVCVTRYRA